MGLSHWTSVNIFLLACIRLSLQEVTPTEDFSPSEEELIVSRTFSPIGLAPVTEYPPSEAPTWLDDNEASFSDESHTDMYLVHGPTYNTPVLESDQLQIDMLLLDKSQETDEYVQTATPIYELTDRHRTVVAIVEPPMVPLVTDSYGSASPWPEISSQLPFTPDFTTVNVSIELIPEAVTSLETLLYPLLEEDDVQPVNSTVLSSTGPQTDADSSLPYIWDISKQAVTDSRLHEDEPTEMASFEVPTKENNMDEVNATEDAPFVISEVIPDKILEVSAEKDVHQTYEDVSNVASTMTVNITDTGFILHGSTAPTDPASWDCNHSSSEKCDFSMTQRPTPHEVEPTLLGLSPLLSSPPIFITLHADWNTSVADWGIAWEALVYGSVGLYGSVALLALLSIFCLVFRCPSGGFYFSLLHLLLIALGVSRAFSLFYDAYGHQDRLPAFTALLLHDLAFPCMTSSFSIAFLLLCSRCRLQHSSPSVPRLCLLASAALLHFITAGGAVVVVDLLQQFPFLLLVSRGFYVILTVVLSFSFFIFCCIARTQSTQIYDLKSSAPPTEYISGCPIANLKDWCRATHVVLLSACFGILNAGLQLYAVLYALGYGGSIVFSPWPWWAFQLSSSLCEVGICFPLALIGAYPIFCANEIGRTNCWTQVFRLSPGHVTMKAPILQTSHQWASSQHEKLLVCDTIARSDSEFFPLYTLVEKRLSHGEDLSLIYHSNKSLEVQGLTLPHGYNTPSYISVQIDSDSTVDFHPPSPINLRRSIDEALFSESLIPKSLFHGTTLSSSLSLTVKSSTKMEDCVFKEKASDRGLYRTSSCMEIEAGLPLIQPIPTTRQDTPASSSPGVWRGEQSTASSLCKMSLDGSSLVLCSSPEHVAPSTCKLEGKQEPGCKSKEVYHTLTSPSKESLDTTAQPGDSLRDDLINVFGPIDALSVCSDTIDL
ncbi:proline-rich transmembrane protein 4 [Bufo gargarizans]|uniref:proline-rich transmembrane protein 4 n=1 Tax=Bufo gargarizans TaxID=30331 RepID=UPI001CF42D77|nr:proline-rich transmembrane protein 4 [Bufo gargarizans]